MQVVYLRSILMIPILTLEFACAAYYALIIRTICSILQVNVDKVLCQLVWDNDNKH